MISNTSQTGIAKTLTPLLSSRINAGDISKIYSQHKLSQTTDIRALKGYNADRGHQLSRQTAYHNNLTNASDRAVGIAASAGENTVNIQAASASLRTYTASATAAGIANAAFMAALNIGIVIAVTKAIEGIANAISNYVHRTEIANQKTREAIQHYDDLKSNAAELGVQINDLNRQIKTMDPIANAEDIARLKSQTGELALQKKILEEQAAIAHKDAEKAAIKSANTSVTSHYKLGTSVDPYNGIVSEQSATVNVSKQEELADSMDEYKKLESNLVDAQTKQAGYSEDSSKYKEQQDLIDQYMKKMDAAQERAVEMAASLEMDTQGLYGFTEESLNLKDSIAASLDSYLGFLDYIDAPDNPAADLRPNNKPSKDESSYSPRDKDDQDSINTYQSDISTLKSTSEKLKSGELASSDRVDLMQQFPALASASGDLGGNIDTMITSSLQSLMDSLGTDVSPALIESFREMAIEAMNADESISTLSDTLTDMDGMDENFGAIGSAYSEFQSGGRDAISAKSLNGISEAFEDVEGVDMEGFLETLNSSASTAEEVEAAFSSLSNQYVASSGCLNNLTEATAAQTIQDLESVGVTNASEIITAALAEQQRGLALEKQYLTDLGYSLTNITAEEINGMVNEGYFSAEAGSQLAGFALQKQFANGITLSTAGDIKSLASLAGASKEVITAIDAVANAKAALAGGAQGSLKLHYEQVVANSEQKINSFLNEGLNVPPPKSPPKTGGGGSRPAAPKAPPRDTTKSFNWIETALKRIKEAFDRLKAVASATYRLFSERNSALSQEFANLRQQIEMNQNAYAVYMAKADAVGLSHEYQAKVQNGSISIEDIKDESLQKQIEEYKKYYESAMDCADAVEELRNQLSKLAKEKFDLVSSEYSNQLSLIEMDSKRIQDNIDETETRGHMVSTKYYEKLIALEQKNLELLKQKRAAMQAALDEAVASNDVPVGSEDWYKMRQEIDDVDQAIRDSNTSLLEFNNNIRDLQWERFDQLQENISHITDEADFLISLFDDKELFDEQGNRNENGKAVAGLHAVNYNTHMQQSDDYGKEIAAIDQQLQADPYNQELIKRRYELVEAQRESIQAAQQEKQAIRDLVEQGINAQLDSMQKLIDKRREALNAEKELYDYQKSVEQKTKAVTDIQKQLDAYQGDDSEETKAKLQKLRVSLDSAETDLEETEYDKYISDQEQLLDSLYTEYEEILNARLDNIDSLLSDIITEVNASSGVIGAAITQAAADSGVKLSDGMKAIWDSSIYPVVAPYNELFSTTLTTVSNTITTIKDFMQQMINKSDQDAQQQTGVPNASDPQPQAPADTPAPPADPGPSAPSFPWISKKDNFPKNRLDTENSIVDRLKLHDFDSSMSARSTYYAAMGGSGHYSGTDSQNIFMLNWMKQNGYKRGVRDILKKQLAWTQEDGRELIYRSSDGAMLTPLQTGDKVFTRQMSDNLWTLAQKNPVTPNILSAAVLPAADNLAGITSSLTPVSNDISMEVVLPNVTSYKEFKTELVKDRQFEQAMQDAIIGKALGKNNLQKYSRI